MTNFKHVVCVVPSQRVLSLAEDDAARIIAALAKYPDATIKMECFNEDDASEIRFRIPPDERRRVWLTWTR